jgi:hypothetical protein
LTSALRPFLAAAAALLLLPASTSAQAFTPPPQVGSVTLSWQWVDNTGHVLSDGTFLPLGESVTTSALVEADYGVTERFAATAAVPYIFAKYTGGAPPISGLPVDTCRCWNSSFQDFSIAGRYRFGDEFWAITPNARLIVPTHNYAYRGEAVVGPNLTQVLIGIAGGLRLAALPKASLQAGYTYALVEKATEDLRANRGMLTMSAGYAITRSWYVHAGALYTNTLTGLTIDQLPEAPLEEQLQADRLLKMRYWHLTGGVSYSTGFADLFVSIEPYVWGRDTHDGVAYTVGSTWYFDFARPRP